VTVPSRKNQGRPTKRVEYDRVRRVGPGWFRSLKAACSWHSVISLEVRTTFDPPCGSRPGDGRDPNPGLAPGATDIRPARRVGGQATQSRRVNRLPAIQPGELEKSQMKSDQ